MTAVNPVLQLVLILHGCSFSYIPVLWMKQIYATRRVKSNFDSTVCFFPVRNPADDDSGKDYHELYDAINGLTSSEKATVLLFYIEDYSTKEIAEILGMASVTVRSHLHRARKHLKKILEQNGER